MPCGVRVQHCSISGEGQFHFASRAGTLALAVLTEYIISIRRHVESVSPPPPPLPAGSVEPCAHAARVCLRARKCICVDSMHLSRTTSVLSRGDCSRRARHSVQCHTLCSAAAHSIADEPAPDALRAAEMAGGQDLALCDAGNTMPCHAGRATVPAGIACHHNAYRLGHDSACCGALCWHSFGVVAEGNRALD